MNLSLQETDDNNIYEQYVNAYIKKGYSVTPGKYGKKMPAIKAWTDYCYRLPTSEEVKSWSQSFTESNIDMCLGPASGVVALDIDTVDQRILDIIMPILPESPFVKVGAKGETRFFKYTGETTDILKFNGEVVIELLSSNKKTTLPPSLHPNGVNYKWIGQPITTTLAATLPILPPALFAHLASKLKLSLPDLAVQSTSSNKVFSGRNDELSSLCGKLINENKPVDEVVRELIKADESTSDTPLFSDPEEMRHTEAYTNALMFYTNHLNSINTKRYRDSKEYEIPAMQTVADMEKLEEIRLGKSLSKEKLKNVKKLELPHALGVLGTIYQNILNNSWVKQPDLAFGASLTLMSTLISRKVVFQGMSPNLYVLNISPSGSGKDAPQQEVKKYLIDINADSILGAGDYVSDASLMDSLEVRPVRLDVMDEAGGILKNINGGRSDYNGKMADILAELYTSSNSKYLGRATAEGTKGSCYRPNVNILASTTPVGFSDGISIKAIEKGLMGRFLVFTGNPHQKAARLRNFPKLDSNTKNHLKYWYTFNPMDEHEAIGNIPQNFIELEATAEAEKKLDEIFNFFDNLRRDTKATSPLLPIIARLYQQMIKVVIVHACSRQAFEAPVINNIDVEFGFNTIQYYFETIKEIINRYIFNNQNEREASKILNLIKDTGGIITKSELSRKTRSMTKRQRDAVLDDIIDSDQLIRDVRSINGKNQTVYIYCGGEYED